MNNKILKLNSKKDILILLIGNIPRVILLVLYIRLQTYFLDYENLSKYYLLFSVYSFLGIVFINPIALFLNRHLLNWFNGGNLNSSLKKVFAKIILPLGLLTFVIIICFIFFYNHILGNIIFHLIGFLILFLFLSKTICDFILNSFNILGKNLIFMRLTVTFHLLSPIISVLLVTYFESSYLFWFLGLIFSNLLIGLIGWGYLKRLSANNKPLIDLSQLKSFSKNLIIASFLGWLLTDGFRFISEIKIGLFETGILILGIVSVNQIYANLEVLINQFIMPNYLNKINGVKFKLRSIAFNKLFNLTIPVYIIISILIFSFSELIINILIDKSKINDSFKQIFLISIGVEFLRVLMNVLKNITVSEYQSKPFLTPYLIGSLLLLICLYFEYFDTAISIAYLILLCFIIIFISSIYFMNKILKIKVNFTLILKNLLPILPFYVLVNLNTEYSFIIQLLLLLASLTIIFKLVKKYLTE